MPDYVVKNFINDFIKSDSLSAAHANLNLGSAALSSGDSFDVSGLAASAQAFSIQRENHTGTQPVSSLSDPENLTLSNDSVISAITQNVSASLIALNLGNVDNTSDADKPVSTATQTALDAHGLNVRDYGAVGDGVTDDTTAVQNALDAVGATGGTLVFPPGTYLVGHLTYEFDGGNIVGAGPKASILQLKAGETGTLLTINEADASYFGRAMSIDGLGLVGVSGSSHGILMHQKSNIVLRNLRIASFGGDGIRTDDTTGISITNVDSRNNAGNGYSGGYKNDACTIINSNFQANGGWGIVFNHTDESLSNNGNFVVGSGILKNTSGGIQVRNCRGLTIQSNYIENNSVCGIQIGTSGGPGIAAVMVQSNYFSRNPISILSYATQALVFKYNMVEAAATGVIKLSGSDSPLDIEGNSLITAGYQLQLSDDATNITGLTQGGCYRTTDLNTGAMRYQAVTSSTADLVQFLDASGVKNTWINYLGQLNGGDAITTSSDFGITRTDTDATQFLRLVQNGDGAYGSAMVAIQKDSTSGTSFPLYLRQKAATTIAKFASNTADVFTWSTTAQTFGEGINVATGTTTGTKIGTGATQKIGFWNATPVTQPAANADTSGATLGELETEVNELKALLRTVGLMAP